MSPKERNTFLITVAVMSSTVMQVLDTTIVNVALPHMQGSLAATSDQISWVLTSYLVSSAIFMPLTGYFADRLGQKRYLMLSIAGFTLASALCGLSTSIVEIVLFRLVQGVFGAALVPLSQAIMIQTYPPQRRGEAMAIWGMGVMVGPILGPTLGGYLTEVLSWRWTFFINLPVGLLSLFLAWRVVPDTDKRQRTLDWTGLVLMGGAIGALQYVLDRGNQDNWFDSRTILALSLVAGAALLGFIYHAATHKGQVLFRLAIFRDRNFTISSLLIALIGLGLYGSMLLQPLMLEGLMGYPVLFTGMIMAPRGLASMFSMMIAGRLAGRVDTRLVIGTGIALAAVGSYGMTGYAPTVSTFEVVWPLVFQGLGMGLIFTPLSTVAYATLAREYTAEAAGLFSLMRTVGSSVGISIVSTMLVRNTQALWNQLGGHINGANPALYDYLARLQLDLHSPQAARLLGKLLHQQAGMVAFLDCFVLVTLSFVVMFPFLLLLRRDRRADAVAVN